MNPSDSLRDERAELDMTPMIDVTFLLLIFFMCTLKFKLLEGQLSAFLPKDAGKNETPVVPVEKVQVQVRLVDPGQKMNAAGTAPYSDETGQARHTFHGRQLSYGLGTQRFDSLDSLDASLAHFADAKGQPCVLQPYAGVILGDVVPVLDHLTAAGFVEISFGGEFDER